MHDLELRIGCTLLFSGSAAIYRVLLSQHSVHAKVVAASTPIATVSPSKPQIMACYPRLLGLSSGLLATYNRELLFDSDAPAMVGTQLLLGKMTQKTSADPMMNGIATWMALLLGFMFYGQPSALLLYWITGNLLAVGTQYWLGKRYA